MLGVKLLILILGVLHFTSAAPEPQPDPDPEVIDINISQKVNANNCGCDVCGPCDCDSSTSPEQNGTLYTESLDEESNSNYGDLVILNVTILDDFVVEADAGIEGHARAKRETVSTLTLTHFMCVAYTKWGSIPGKANLNDCIYSFDNAVYTTSKAFTFLTFNNPIISLLPSGAVSFPPPAKAHACAYQVYSAEYDEWYYPCLAKTGAYFTPGKASGPYCWYASGEEEKAITKDFYWVLSNDKPNLIVLRKP